MSFMRQPNSHLTVRPFGFIDELASTQQRGPVVCTRDVQPHPRWAIAIWHQQPGLATTRQYAFNTAVLHFGGSRRVERRRDGLTTHVEALIGGVTTIPEGMDIEFDVHEPIRVLQLYFDQDYIAEVVGEEHADRIGMLPELFCSPDTPSQALMQALRCQLEGDTWASPVGALSLEHTVRATVAQLTHGMGPARSFTPSRIASRRLRQIREYVEARLGEPTSVRELAAMVGLSVEHFCRSFKAETGVTPQAWIHQRRIDRAQELLKQAAVPLAEIALRTGFSSPSHLSRTFKRVAGMTPGEFRRQHLS